jgi:hypothetical protein
MFKKIVQKLHCCQIEKNYSDARFLKYRSPFCTAGVIPAKASGTSIPDHDEDVGSGVDGVEEEGEEE